LGKFSTKISDIGDTQLTLLYRLFDSETHHLHANIGWIIPSGSIEKNDEILSPMNTPINLRLPYSMQLGSGSHQATMGLTYTGYAQQLSWGSQIKARAPIDNNDGGYQLGNKYMLTGWSAYRLADALSASLRLTYRHSEQIDGSDSQISAPVTTENSDNYGVDSVDIALGFNSVIANKHWIALEYQLPSRLPSEWRTNGYGQHAHLRLAIGLLAYILLKNWRTTIVKGIRCSPFNICSKQNSCYNYAVKSREHLMSALILESTITCPQYGHLKTETMPTDAC
jgi:hypothetical protein